MVFHYLEKKLWKKIDFSRFRRILMTINMEKSNFVFFNQIKLIIVSEILNNYGDLVMTSDSDVT